MDNNQYDSFKKSAENFVQYFADYRDKKIVLYGLGQYTAALVSIAHGFHFIGLMDGDENNIGREIYGLRVIGIEEARENADLIVINTSSFYWNLIFERITDIGIPVYFPNGERAVKKKRCPKKLSSDERNLSTDQVKEAIDQADIVSFDIYDTLLMRLVFCPADVFKLVELQAEQRCGRKIPFLEMRNKTIGDLQDENYTIAELYDRMQINYPNENVSLLREIELEMEAAVTVCRKDIVDIYQYAAAQRKEIYILSDMYLPSDYFLSAFNQYDIDIDAAHLWISGELKASKNDRSMWKKYKDQVVGKRKALHIGDNIKADVEFAQESGVQAIKIASASDMLQEIVPARILSEIHSVYGSITTGMIANDLFNSPFVWHGMGEKFCIKTCRQFGRVIFGNVVLTYLLWLLEESRRRNIKSLVFLSRDGYFLEKDYLKLVNKFHIESAPESYYMFVSRKAVLTLAAKDAEAFAMLLEFSYTGTFKSYLNDRFDIEIEKHDKHAACEIQLPKDKDRIKVWLEPYLSEIHKKIDDYSNIYGNYLNEFNWDSPMAIVDICYTGTIQYWLKKVLNKKISGFYFVANIAEDNLFNREHDMIPCFQSENDHLAEKSAVWKNHKIVESFFTAPYGTMKAITDCGEFITYEQGNNQKYFMQRELMNAGCNEYIADYIKLLKKMKIMPEKVRLDPICIDRIFGNWFENEIVYSANIKKCFWHEDGFINAGKEVSLF